MGHYKARLLGLHRGASDLFFPYPAHGRHGLWVEIKRDGWKLTSAEREHHARQMLFIERMREQGYAAEFCVGVDECIAAIDNYMLGC